MKKTFILILIFLFSTEIAHAAISRDLFVGTVGEDVRELQQFLNTDSRTQVATFGAGSPGNETTYFGPLTLDAVKRFQAVYSATILAPLGLSAPTGYFGPSSRAQIEALGGFQEGAVNYPTPPTSDKQTTPNTSPEDLKNLAIERFDDYANIVRGQMKNGGATNQEINKTLEAIREALDDADYSKVLNEPRELPTADKLINTIKDAGGDPDENTIRDILEQFNTSNEPLSSLLFSLVIPKAHAQTGLVPYGALFNIPYPCICSGAGVWQMYITGYIGGVPTEFSLDYVLGTQLYLFYTLPYAQKQVGFFYPQSGLCWQGVPPACSVVPSVGTVIPIVGSSLFY